MVRKQFSTGFLATFLTLFFFPLHSGFSEAQNSIEENALRQVVMLHPSSGIGDDLGAGLIVGEDDTKIYIATAVGHVAGDDREMKMVEFRDFPGIYRLSSIHGSEHTFKSMGIAVITVEKQAAFPIKTVGVQRSVWDVSPSTVRFVGFEGEKSRWKVTSDFPRSLEPKLGLPSEHQLHEGEILTRTFFNLKGYKGSAMFDQGWRLFGIVLDDKKFNAATDRNSGEEVFDDEFTTTLFIQKLVDGLQKKSIPVFPHLLLPKSGAIPHKNLSSIITVTATVTRDERADILNISLYRGDKYDGSPITYTIQAKDEGQWMEYRSGKTTELASVLPQEMTLPLPSSITDIRFCFTHPYMDNRYIVIVGNTENYAQDKQNSSSKDLYQNGNPMHSIQVSSAVFTSREDACDTAFGDTSTAIAVAIDLGQSQENAVTNKQLLDQATALRGRHVPLSPQKVIIGSPIGFHLNECLGKDRLPCIMVFRLFPKYRLEKAGGFRLYTKITVDGESELVVRADVEDMKYGAIVKTVRGLATQKLSNLDTCMVSDLDKSRKIGVMNRYIVNELESRQGAIGATYSMNVEKVLDADKSLSRIKVHIGENDLEVCPGFAERESDAEFVSSQSNEGVYDLTGDSLTRSEQLNRLNSLSLPSGCRAGGLPGDIVCE